MCAAIGQALLWGLLGALVAPVAALVVETGVYRLSSGCGTPGDSGGCEMGIIAIMIASVPFGAGLFSVVSLVRSIWLRRRADAPRA